MEPAITDITSASSAPSVTLRRVERFIERRKDPVRRKELSKLLNVISRATKLPAQMWGADTVGFGRYAYKTKSGRESEFAITGFSPKERRLMVYVDPRDEALEDTLERLGKFERGKGCIQIRRLKDVDLKVLEELVRKGTHSMKKRYKTWDE